MTIIDLFAEPANTNLAWQWVLAVLPGDATSPWGKTLQVFTAVLFAAGSFGLAYGVVMGIVNSAYTGKVLGQRWHQIWTPLRIVLGLGLLAPMPTTGFSAAHYMLRDVVARGAINLADATWNVFVTTVAKDGVPIVPISEAGSSLAVTVLRHEICAAVYNEGGSYGGWSVSQPSPRGEVSMSGSTPLVSWSYGGTCGHFSFSIPERRERFSDARRDAVAEIISAFRPEAKRYAKLAVETTGISSAEGIDNAVGSAMLSPKLVQDIRAAGVKYDKAVASAAKTEAADLGSESRGKLVEAAEQQGFLAAGMYWRSLSEISALTTSLTNEAPEEVAPRTDGDFGSAIDRAFRTLALQVSGEVDRVNLSANDFASAGDESADFLTKLLAPIARSMAEWASSADAATDKDAMGSLISSGHAMIAAGWAAIAAGGAAMVASSNWFAEALGAGGAASWFLDWSKWVVGGLMILGALRAYVIPMMPFVFMMMAGIATLAALMEAMIAVPLWCLKWCKMDNGEDFAGESVRMGLLLTVNLALRPVLAVLALAAAYPVFDATLGTLEKLWPTAFLAQTGGHVVGGLMILGALRAYVIPMMPFVFMMMAGIATLAALMEAMIAVPLWCLKWCRMDNGEDFAGESVRMGLLLTINLALRPVLAVLALAAAYPVFDATLGTLDKLWPTAFLAQTGGHVVGLVGFLVLTAMQAYLVWFVVMKGFGQIWGLPDRVLTWLGPSGSGGEAGMTSNAVGGMLALAGRGNLPRMGVPVPKGGKGGRTK